MESQSSINILVENPSRADGFTATLKSVRIKMNKTR